MQLNGLRIVKEQGTRSGTSVNDGASELALLELITGERGQSSSAEEELECRDREGR